MAIQDEISDTLNAHEAALALQSHQSKLTALARGIIETLAESGVTANEIGGVIAMQVGIYIKLTGGVSPSEATKAMDAIRALVNTGTSFASIMHSASALLTLLCMSEEEAQVLGTPEMAALVQNMTQDEQS